VPHNFSEDGSAAVVAESFAGATDPRLREVLTGLVGHLHQFVKDVERTEAELEHAIAFLTEAGPFHVVEAGSPYIDSDAVFGVKASLVRDFAVVDDPDEAARHGLPNPFRHMDFEVVLAGSEPA